MAVLDNDFKSDNLIWLKIKYLSNKSGVREQIKKHIMAASDIPENSSVKCNQEQISKMQSKVLINWVDH